MLELKIPRRLESPNKSRGAHWRVRHRITQEWEQEIWACLAPQPVPAWMKGRDGHMVHVKMRVEVERHVPSARNFIRDDDNLRFCVKPALDSLKRLNVIKNDSRKWLDHPTPMQRVSEDGKDYTIIRIWPVEQA